MAPIQPVAVSTDAGLIERLQDLVSENKRAVIIGAAAAIVAAGGVGYYVYSTSSSSNRATGKGSDFGGEKGESGSEKKRKSKKKSVKDTDGPILEERKPRPEDDAVPASPQLTPADIENMTALERKDLASSYKTRGNTAYQAHNFTLAVSLYTKAIQVAKVPEAVFYSNRAACYVNFKPPEYEKVVEDCDEALRLDPMYIKALIRRSNALEKLERDEEALRDLTAATILERFSNDSTSTHLDRVLKHLSSKSAAEVFAKREPRLPSYSFLHAYMSAFRTRPPLPLPEDPSQGDQTLQMACEALDAHDYVHSNTLVQEALSQGITSSVGRAKALNLRGTFRFLVGDLEGGKKDLLESIDLVPSDTQTWVKLASIYMEMGEAAGAFAAFDSALSHDEKDPDVFYHRGQVHFLMQQFDKAAEDYNKSTALDDKFVFSHIQYAVAQYKMGDVNSSMATFRKTMKAFPTRSEPQNYYGELLLDTQMYVDAVEKFDRAIELEKAGSPPVNVLPIVNKALALFQWKHTVEDSEKLLQDALEIDPECDSAIATLAQLYLQTNKLDEASAMFKRHVNIARTQAELEQTFQFDYATRAQREFAKNYPEKAAELEAMARSMAQ